MLFKSSFVSGALLVGVSVGGMLCGEKRASAAGFEVFIRPAYGSAGSTSPVEFTPNPRFTVQPPPDEIWKGTAAPYAGGFMFQGGLGVRLGPVSVGLDGGIRTASATPPSSTNIPEVSRSAWNAGPYVHVYIPGVPLIDPWVGLGVQYVADTQTYKVPYVVNGQQVLIDWRLEHHGVAVPLTLGVDYKILGVLAVGPSFQYALVFPAGGCAKASAQGFVGNNFCANEDESKKITTAKGYGVWSLGLTIRLTVPPV